MEIDNQISKPTKKPDGSAVCGRVTGRGRQGAVSGGGGRAGDPPMTSKQITGRINRYLLNSKPRYSD